MGTEYLIWSIEHTAWWGPNHLGYTQQLHEAGRYTRTQAIGIVEEANVAAFHECRIPIECLGLTPILPPAEEN